MQYKVVFHRYEPVNGGRFMEDFINASDFEDACRIARAMLFGMTVSDTKHRYYIAQIENHGLTGVRCVSGWMTDDELCAKIAAEKAGKK